MDKNSSYIDLMIDSLEKKIDLLEKISEINASQKEIVSNDAFELEELEETMVKKGIYVEEINKLDEGFESLYDRVRDALLENKALYGTQIATMQKLIQQIVELVTAVEVDEKRIKAKVDQQFSRLKSNVKESRKSSKVVSNYYKSMSKVDTEPQFMDKKK